MILPWRKGQPGSPDRIAAAVSFLRRHVAGPSLSVLAIGFALLSVSLLWLRLSHHPIDQGILGLSPICWLVAISMIGGAVFLSLPPALRRLQDTLPLLAVMIGFGLLMRLVLLGSEPMLEIDFYRYLWDGGVLASGQNPYAFAPAEVLAGVAPAELQALAGKSGGIVAQIGHGDLRTIYPPLAQAAFALAHKISPWDLSAWRFVILVSECVTLGLLIALLRAMKLSPLWAALYWWNPLALKELTNSAHMDALLLPFLLGTLLLLLKQRVVPAAGVLALSTGVKLWPLLLLPLVLRPALNDRRRLLGALALFGGLALVLVLPLLTAGLERNAGLVAFATTWERNTAIFMSLSWLIDQGLMAFHLTALDAGRIARVLVGVALAGIALAMAWEPAVGPRDLCRRFAILIAALFLLSPAQYPWYYTWLLPFLAVMPSPALLLLTPLLPLYYLRFELEALGMAEAFDHYVVWLIYLPVILMLLWAYASRPIPGLAARARAPFLGRRVQ